MSEKTYEPHYLIVWTPNGEVAVKEVPYKEDAYEQYADLVQRGVSKIALAKLVKKHVEGGVWRVLRVKK